jgi:hypothetical protein
MEFHGVQPLIAVSELLGHTAALADGDAAYLLWSLGLLSLIAFVAGLVGPARHSRWLRLLQSVALLGLPALLMVGMAVSMMPPA